MQLRFSPGALFLNMTFSTIRSGSVTEKSEMQSEKCLVHETYVFMVRTSLIPLIITQ
uniref:Uncharacterized protein n=1 Tax=Klebsiella pneumoniae TaxID=573 RepID=A0A8B0SS65_KLEPN|nr:hypothetical protein [Klebsiella pneumoniae]